MTYTGAIPEEAIDKCEIALETWVPHEKGVSYNGKI